ncbi:OmpA family protein [Actinomyces howellii]|uniref:Photosystem I P700 chlorophyll a apoprotein A2 n=1 Tax=Actinomyces howellii TaxID=52771 RepID=A0A3S4SNT0_9ACTO|nr:OmpA family protein [Actinomyces howellii]VEG29198.1 Photosystem I P700 chlorophyll a apoprotein A2 [Actinomyces howellii]
MQRHRLLPLPAVVLAAVTAGSLALSGCGTSAPQPEAAGSSATTAAQASTASAQATRSASATASASTVSGLPTAPGYEAGQIPPVPLFTLPDLSLLTSSASSFTPDLTRDISSVPGVTVAPARCDEAGTLQSSGRTATFYGDGSGTYSDSDTTVNNYGDGSGTYTDGTVVINNYGDGSGNYTDSATGITINVYGDGSGTYTDGTLTVNVYGDGSGNWTNNATGEVINIYGDGSGNYTNTTTGVVINNYGDGSGNYTDSANNLVINNYGDGTGYVNEVEVEVEDLPQVPSIGDFPTIDAINPVESCGTVITLEDGVLFDFGSSQVRADAADTLTALAGVLTDSGAPSAFVYGHTDSVSDEAFNQTLSEERAQAVADALRAQGVTATLESAGYGETQPVAPNENPDGTDNPAGRQLNRRVEVFVPAF